MRQSGLILCDSMDAFNAIADNANVWDMKHLRCELVVVQGGTMNHYSSDLL